MVCDILGAIGIPSRDGLQAVTNEMRAMFDARMADLAKAGSLKCYTA